MQSIISNKVLRKQQIYKSNKSGYNCLHQVVEPGNIEAIIVFIRFLRDDFECDSAAILNDLMSQVTKNGYRPCTRGKGKEAVDISKLLSSLKIQGNKSPNVFRQERGRYPRKNHKDQGSSSYYRHGK